MPNSLRCKIKHLCHNGTLTERERDRILKALDQEPCEDAISRQAVLDIAKSSKSNWIDNSVLFKRVNELPSVTPKDNMDAMLEHLWNDVADEESEVEVCGSNFIQLKQDVLNNKQLWRKLREIEDEDSD